MRITNQMMTRFVMQSTVDAKVRYYGAVQRINSGRRVQRPADDAPAADQAINQSRLLKQIETMQHTTQVVSADLKAAELTLRQGADLVTEALSLTLQMANDAYSPTDRASAAQRVTQMREELLHLVNREQPSGRFLFGGMKDDTLPYDPVTGAYVGHTQNREVQVAPDLFLDATVTGAECFGDPEVVFSALEQLAADLNADDLAGIQGAIGSLQSVVDSFAIAQAGLGSRIQVLMDAANLNDDLSLQAEIRRSELIDTDLATEVTVMKSAETALAASLETGKSFLQFSMFNWM
jgi:flagellar hook-associated protein 3 FlgL